MARHKSAEKRLRQSKRRAERNKARLSKMKTLIKKVRNAKDKEQATAALKQTIKYLDQLADAGVIHKNASANKKSRLTKLVNKMG